MEMIRFKIRVSCEGCDGHGVVSDRHPNDPSARDIPCNECDGSGCKEHIESYPSIVDARFDYPEACSFTYLCHRSDEFI
jgi:DnaJ-class molecular chaperone